MFVVVVMIMMFAKVQKLLNLVFTQQLARKIVVGLSPSHKFVNPRAPLAVSQCVSRGYVPTVPVVRCGEESPESPGGLLIQGGLRKQSLI